MQNWLRLNADIPVPEIGKGGEGGRREKGHWLPTFSQMRVTVTWAHQLQTGEGK